MDNKDWEITPLEGNDFEVTYDVYFCEPTEPWGFGDGDVTINYITEFPPLEVYEEDVNSELVKEEHYSNPLAGWTITEEICEGEVNEDLIKDIVKDIQTTQFDKSLEGLIDG